ncbi:MAG: proliferating cell nuclear antigen (pcna) [Candidatus Nanoarchaeia archaeon]
MLVKLDNPILLVKAIDVISELVTEVRIKVNDSGINIIAIDPANVAMVSFTILKAAFSQFETGPETLGINLDNFKRILRRCGSGSSIILEKKGNLLSIQIQDRIKRNFTLNLIEVEREEKEIPNLRFDCAVKMNSIDFVDSVEDCAVVADACSFIIKENKFMIESRGLNSARAEFSGDEAEITTEVAACKSRYSLEYLQKFAKGSKLVDKTILKFSEDHPLRMDLKTTNLELSFILAPRVETVD